MSINVGDRIPSATFKARTQEGMKDVPSDELFRGKKVVLFAVPGAFTPTCSDVHLPGYIHQLDALLAKGVDTVACIAVNDPFVLFEWRKARNIPDRLLLLSDGNGQFTEALGLVLDASRFLMGKRSCRYAAIVEDGVVKMLGVEPAGEVGVSSADAVLKALST